MYEYGAFITLSTPSHLSLTVSLFPVFKDNQKKPTSGEKFTELLTDFCFWIASHEDKVSVYDCRKQLEVFRKWMSQCAWRAS